MEDKIRRVFFHELGHFIAREINHLKYDGPIPIQIKIFPCTEDPMEFCGETVPKPQLDPKMAMIGGRTRLPSYLLSLSYGCIFQSYYTQQDLNFCFQYHGASDFAKASGTLVFHKIFQVNDLLSQLDHDILNTLCSEKLLEGLMELEIEKYLIPKGENCFEVDIDKLRKDTADFVAKHFQVYEVFIDMYTNVVNHE